MAKRSVESRPSLSNWRTCIPHRTRSAGLGLRAAAELDVRSEAARTARLAQRYAAEQALKIADEGVQLFGGYGFVRDYPLEMWYRNARSLSALDGLVGV